MIPLRVSTAGWRFPRLGYASLLLAGVWASFMGAPCVSAAAETGTNMPSFVVKSWRTIDGLPQNSVLDIAQTADGYLWLGTRGGLVRFDGVRLSTYGLDDGLKSLTVWKLLNDGQGGLWIGTTGGGLSHWRHGVITTLTTADGLAHNDVLVLAPAEAGAVWVGTAGGLQHWGPDGFTRLGEAEPLRHEVSALASSRGGGLWVAVLPSGLYHCSAGRCEAVEGPPEHRRIRSYAVLEDREGDLWVSIGNGMVLRRHAGTWTEFNQTDGLPESNAMSLAQGPSGEIWACSQEEGLYVFRAGRFQEVPGVDPSVRSVRPSPDGVVWVGTRAGGLYRLTPRKLLEYPVGQEKRRGQPNGLVEAPPGQFWVTTFGGGLFHGGLDRLELVQGAGLEALEDRPFLTSGLKMRDGAVYVAGAMVLLRRAPGTGEFSVLTNFNGTVRALCEGEDGALWAGTREGETKRMVNGALQTVTNGVFPAQISTLVRGPGAALWVGTLGAGLYRWDAGRIQRWTTAEGLPTDVVRTLYQDGEGTLWIGTGGGGLAWMRDGHFHSVSTRHGLGDGVISQILEDGTGNLWLGCNRGIFRVSKRELQDVAAGRAAAVHPLALDEADGMSVAECTGGYSPAGLRSQSGTLYFSTVRGVVEVDPARFGSAPDPPAVLIEAVKLDGKPLPLRGGALSLPPGSRDLEIEFTAFNYVKPEQIRFRHRVEGRNQEWSEVEGARSVRYSRLSPGDYVFEVAAANLDGRWPETGARLPFTVRPSLWQTWWFRGAALAALFGFGGLTTWWLLRRQHQRELQELEHTRARQAEMAHLSRVSMLGELSGSLAHELNQPLTAILSNAQAAQRFLAGNAPDINEIRDILGDIVKEDQRAGEVIRRLRLLFNKGETEHRPLDVNEAVQEAIQLTHGDLLNRGVTVHSEIAPDLPAVGGDRVQLQQVVLNLLMNACDAMRETPADERRILVRTEMADARTLRVSVADRGHGLPPEPLEKLFQPFFTTKAQGMGLGLSICRTIIGAHRGKLWAANHGAGRGATFYFTLPAAAEGREESG